LVHKSQVIAVEDLHVKGLMKNPNLAKAIGDVGWGLLTQMLKYKAHKAGKGYIEVNRFFPSSKACSTCGHVARSLPLSIRAWTCEHCGALHDRDVNAAKNIAQEAQRIIAAGIAVTANRGIVRRGPGRKRSVLADAVEVGSPVL
jgi:putative transposase